MHPVWNRICLDISHFACSLQIWILLLGIVRIFQGHPESKLCQQSPVFLLIFVLSIPTKHTCITATKWFFFPLCTKLNLREIWDRTVWNDCQSQIFNYFLNHEGKLKHYQHLTVFCCHQFLPGSLNTDQYKHRYKCVQSRCILQLFLQLKPHLY